MLTRAAARAGRGQIQQSLMSSAASDLSERQQLTVKHDLDSCELLIEMPGSDAKAYLQYDHGPDGVVDLQHTVVPESFRGKGVAKILAKAAFDYVVEQDLKMKLSCWYLQKYIKDNPSSEHVARVVE